ncbi:hypothetical protein BWI96_17270 [Siphonobacter sp. SORGH_AS_0500]|uniref:hypothetical protein n=1 Tax=Siphonobacter sp. SORGH_AS_0500 TaxID=1864824 RepID=UPI000CB7E3DC|nr:hypothetical protein [Siphonobacter sp. SORGH_AS_0500]PKK35287.1 hypothetical protein BWI96_17270 [Siphonobacter sp. SORGH_AS_0500]
MKLGKLTVQYAGNQPKANQDFAFTEIFYRDWSGYQLDTLGNTNLLLTDDRFKFVTIKNEEWYSSDQSKGFVGYVNYYASLSYRFNDPMYPTRYSLSPNLKLKWVLETIFSQLGYRLERAFFNEYSNLHLYTNKSLDEQVPDLVYPFNQFKDTIQFGEHLPDLTLREFLEGLGVMLFHRWELDPVLKVIRFIPLDSLATSNPQKDFSNQVVKEYLIQANESTEHQFRFSIDGSDALAKDSIGKDATDQEKNSSEIFKPYPETESTETEKTERHESVFSPLYQEQAYLSSVPATVYGMLMAKQRGISPLYDQEDTSPALPRLFFYAGLALVADVKNSIETSSIDASRMPPADCSRETYG